MPAITADTLTLPRVPRAGLGDVERPVLQVTTAPQGYEGEGFPVRRAFAGLPTKVLDPFIMMDQMGEVEYAPGEPKGTSWHPHRGFETVTYIIDGAFQHQDSRGRRRAHPRRRHAVDDRRRRHPAHRDAAGGARRVRRGVPRPAAVGQPARPREDDRAGVPEPRGLRRRAAGRPTTAARCCASSPASSPARAGPGATRTPITMLHASVQPGAQLSLPWDPRFNALVYVLSGTGTAGTAQARAPDRADRGVRPRRPDHGRGRPGAGQPARRARGRRARRRADPRAGRAVRPVRDEQPGAAAAGGGGLPVGPLRARPARTRSCRTPAGRSVHQRAVDELPQLRPQRVGARRQQLGGTVRGDLLDGVDPERRAGGAAPGELAGAASAPWPAAGRSTTAKPEPEADAVEARLGEHRAADSAPRSAPPGRWLRVM